MAVICPTVTASGTHEYREQMELLEQFAFRVHIDLMDGEFAPSKSVDVDHVWWGKGLRADVHLMYKNPSTCISHLLELKPGMVIVHAEADDDLTKISVELHQRGIKAGLAVLPETALESVAAVIPHFDHLMVFGGNLGFQGGKADLTQLEKVRHLQSKYPHLEIGWDGGINDQNAQQLIDAGVSVLNVGSFIHNADFPADAYHALDKIAGPDN